MRETIHTVSVPEISLNNGMKIPCIGMGTFGSDRYSAQQVSQAVEGAIRCGWRMFDCAPCYGNEAQIGDIFHRAFEEKTVERRQLTVMTKVWNDMHDRVEESITKSIEDLKCGYIDLFFIHWPFPNYHPPGCSGDSRSPDARPFDAAEYIRTYRQCEEMVKRGLARGIGVSNMTIQKLEAILPQVEISPAVCELECHPLFQQQKLFDYLLQKKIQPIAYMPLGSPQRPDRDVSPEDKKDLEHPVLIEIGRRHGIHPALIALKWAVQRGQIPIPFSIRQWEYESNLRCVAEDPLTEDEMEMIAELEENNRLVKGQVFLWEGARDWHDIWDEPEL